MSRGIEIKPNLGMSQPERFDLLKTVCCLFTRSANSRAPQINIEAEDLLRDVTYLLILKVKELRTLLELHFRFQDPHNHNMWKLILRGLWDGGQLNEHCTTINLG